MKGIFKKSIAFLVVFTLLLSSLSNLFFVSADFANEQMVNDLPHIVAATAKMRRPLYIGLDDEIRTDANGNEWHYFDPYKIGNLLEITATLNDGSTKVFDLNSAVGHAYSNYSAYFDFDKINTDSAPLKAGETYLTEVSYTCNYRYPYVTNFDLLVEVEVASQSVTGITAAPTNTIPNELRNTDGQFSAYLTHPTVGFTLSDGSVLPVDMKESDSLYGGYFSFDSDQSEDNSWLPGKEYEFDVNFSYSKGNYTAKMPVKVESYGYIDTITGKANEPIYESIQGYVDNRFEGLTYNVFNYDVDVTVNFSGGKALTYNFLDNDFHTTGIGCDYFTDEWEVGKPAEIHFKRYYSNENDYYEPTFFGEFTMEFLPNPIESFSVVATTPVQYGRSGWEETDADGNTYTAYYADHLHLFYTVKFNDGRPDMVNVCRSELYPLKVYVTETDQETNHFKMGKNTVTATIADMTATYDAYLVDKYIKDVKLKSGVTVIEGMFAFEEYHYDPESFENYYYKYSTYNLVAHYDVVLYDGFVITEATKNYEPTGPDIYAYFRHQWSGDRIEQTYETRWKVGDKFNLTLTIETYDNDKVDLTVPVTVVENKSIFKTGHDYENSSIEKGFGLTVTGLNDVPEDRNLVIPEKINGYTVKWVNGLSCEGWCHGEIKSLTLPDSVKEIRKFALSELYDLERVDLNMVSQIESNLFEFNYNIKEVKISENNPNFTIVNNVIYSKDLTKFITAPVAGEAVIEPTVTEIRNIDFSDKNRSLKIMGKNTRLVSVENPDGYDYVSEFPFIYCYKGSAAEADAIALGIDYATFSDIPLAPESEKVVTVTAYEDAKLPENTALSVKKVGSAEKQVIYDISLVSSTEKVQPLTPVTVAIDLPEGMSAERTKVFRIEDDGSKTNMKATFKDGKLIFTTDHFSHYLLEEVTYTPGDVNDDDTIDLNDVVTLAQFVAGWEVEHNENAIDTNGDGDDNLNDVVALAQFVAGWEVKLH